MKRVVAICAALLYACAVFGIEVPTLPQTEFATRLTRQNAARALDGGGGGVVYLSAL